MDPKAMQMIEETELDVVAYREFIMLFKKNIHKLFCFVEGDDDAFFYHPRIKERSNFDLQFLPCYGKDNVISIYNTLKNKAEYNKAKVVFFC